MKDIELIPHLFRTEYSKIVAVLCKVFGLSNIQFAEDVVSETFLVASETWRAKGVPDKPTAWLYQVAKNKVRDAFKREKVFFNKVKPDLEAQIASEHFEIDLSEKNVLESQLQMLFVVSNPIVSPEAQVGLALRILCGFGIDEIAAAFLTNKETVNKRLFRAKQKLKQADIKLEFPSEKEIYNRLDRVLSVLYLLFNEGYYSLSSETTLKKDLCYEAIRLTHLLSKYGPTNLPKTNALLALMCFHASRLDSRIDKNGGLILYEDQNRYLWDEKLIAKGNEYLHASAQGEEITKYHLEAGIAFLHSQKEDVPEKWEQILQMYNQLLQIEYSPIAALNRTYALSKANSPEEAIEVALKIELKGNHLYYSLLAELYKGHDDGKHFEYLEAALAVVDSQRERELILKKMATAK